MLSIFLNIGAGDKLLGIRSFGEFSGEKHDYVVFNTDIGYEKISQVMQSPSSDPEDLKNLFKHKTPDQIIADLPEEKRRTIIDAEKQLNSRERGTNFEYGSATHIMLQDGTVEMIFAISPFGYEPLNTETHRVLKTDGIVVVGGNNRNRFVKKPYAHGCTELFEKLDFFPSQVKDILVRLGSQTTHGDPIAAMEYSAYIKLPT